jgi:predicted RNase H-like nuclease (RuvC/YqgF family)
MAAPTFPIFQQARLQYRAAAPLHNFTADLGQLLEADSRIAHLEQNLTDRQKDRRRFHKIENLKPKLDRRIEKLRKEIHDEQQKIKKVKQEVNQVEWWTNKFQSMTGQTGALTEAEELVKIVKDDFIKEFKLPVEVGERRLTN